MAARFGARWARQGLKVPFGAIAAGSAVTAASLGDRFVQAEASYDASNLRPHHLSSWRDGTTGLVAERRVNKAGAYTDMTEHCALAAARSGSGWPIRIGRVRPSSGRIQPMLARTWATESEPTPAKLGFDDFGQTRPISAKVGPTLEKYLARVPALAELDHIQDDVDQIRADLSFGPMFAPESWTPTPHPLRKRRASRGELHIQIDPRATSEGRQLGQSHGQSGAGRPHGLRRSNMLQRHGLRRSRWLSRCRGWWPPHGFTATSWAPAIPVVATMPRVAVLPLALAGFLQDKPHRPVETR